MTEEAMTPVRRRVYVTPTRYETIDQDENAVVPTMEGMQLDGSIEYVVLHLAGDGADDASDFRDVRPIGSSTTEIGAMRVVEDHRREGGDGDLWFLRGAGRDGEEIHAGNGRGLRSRTTYRIVKVKGENRR